MENTPLHVAAWKGHKEVAELLIGKGADVNAKNKDGWTSLHLAAGGGYKEIADLLIAKGADLNAKIESGQTPLDIAIENKHWYMGQTETADIIRKHGGKTGDWLNADKSIHIAASAGHIEAVKQHLANGVDVNAKDEWGQTPLLWASSEGYKEIAELLIAEGADVNAKRNNGETPLHFAAINDHKEVIELLIANGADVNANEGWVGTPLDWAEPYEDCAYPLF